MIPIAMAILGALAPYAGDIVGGLAGMLGGKNAEAAAKVMVDKASSMFGSNDPEVIKAKLAADTAAAQVLAQKYTSEVAAATEMYRIEVQDRESARARDLELRRIVDAQGVPAGTNARANVMLIGAFICFVIIVFGVMFYRNTMPDGVLAILNIAIGSLLAMLQAAFNFEFGSSRGSSEKSNQIVDMAATAATVAKTAADKVADRK